MLRGAVERSRSRLTQEQQLRGVDATSERIRQSSRMRLPQQLRGVDATTERIRHSCRRLAEELGGAGESSETTGQSCRRLAEELRGAGGHRARRKVAVGENSRCLNHRLAQGESALSPAFPDPEISITVAVTTVHFALATLHTSTLPSDAPTSQHSPVDPCPPAARATEPL